MAVIIDAADYFLHLKAAILRARHSILLVGWDFDARIQLDRSGSLSRSNAEWDAFLLRFEHTPAKMTTLKPHFYER